MERKLTLQEKVQAFIKRQPRTSGKTVSIIIAVLMIPYYGFLGGVLAFCISDRLASILYTIISLNILRNEI